MFEICQLLASKNPKVKKARKPSAKSIRIGVSALVHGREATVVERDVRFANAWFIEINGERAAHSFSRDMIVVL